AEESHCRVRAAGKDRFGEPLSDVALARGRRRNRRLACAASRCKAARENERETQERYPTREDGPERAQMSRWDSAVLAERPARNTLRIRCVSASPRRAASLRSVGGWSITWLSGCVLSPACESSSQTRSSDRPLAST